MANTHSLRLDGNAYIKATVWQPQEFTLSCWLKIDNFNTLQTIFTTNSLNYDLLLNVQPTPPGNLQDTGGQWNTPGQLAFEVWPLPSGSPVEFYFSTTPLVAGVWTFVAFTLKQSTHEAKIYIGNASSTPDRSWTFSNDIFWESGGGFIQIGQRNDSFLLGNIDDLRFWTTVRTGAQLLSDCNHELYGTETGLYGYYKFNNDLTDSTANANHGSAGTGYGADPNGYSFSTSIPFLDGPSSASISPSTSPSLSPSASGSASSSLSGSPSVSPSSSASASQSLSPSKSASSSPSPSQSLSLSPSASASRSLSPSASQSASLSFSPSLSPSFSESPSLSPSASLSPSSSPSPSPSPMPEKSLRDLRFAFLSQVKNRRRAGGMSLPRYTQSYRR